jgi:ATP-dependent exoDNAse (exonuclease V) alpha subunit
LINKKSELAVTQVSEWMQRKLNPADPVKGSPFRVDDKVINNSNGWLTPDNKYCQKNDILSPYGQDAITNANGQVYVANGEMGTVLEVYPKFMTVRMTDPIRIVMVPRGTVEEGSEIGETACNFQLGYCITAHKSQGSQFPYVICMIDESGGARWLGDRSLWYTMLTRAQLACVTIGKRNTIVHASGRSAIVDRKTFLAERMKEAINVQTAGN